MKWIADLIQPKPRHFVIEGFASKCLITGDIIEGYYLYVYEEGKDIFDYLQDTLEIAINQAFEDFGVPKEAWKQVED